MFFTLNSTLQATSPRGRTTSPRCSPTSPASRCTRTLSTGGSRPGARCCTATPTRACRGELAGRNPSAHPVEIGYRDAHATAEKYLVNRTYFINVRVKICANCSEIKHEVAVKQEMMESGAAAGDPGAVGVNHLLELGGNSKGKVGLNTKHSKMHS